MQRFAVNAESARQRTALPEAVDGGDEERSRTRRDRRSPLFADQQPDAQPTSRALARARERPDLGHAGDRGEDARSRHRDAVLQRGAADPRHRAGRQAATADDRQRAGARPPPRPRQRPFVGQRPSRLHARGRPPSVLGDGHRAERSTAAAGRGPRHPPAAHLLRRPSREVAAAGSLWTRAAPRSTSPPPDAEHAAEYHYDGTAGIALSSWIRRAMFALKLRSKDLLISDEITPDSRIVLHRDVRDRLTTLAPFIHWDAHPAPLAANGRIVFVVEGYTTSDELSVRRARRPRSGAPVNYARASVRATVDAFSGQVRPVPDRRVRPDRTCMGRGVSDALPPPGGDARAASRSASISGRPLRGAGDRLRTVPHHPTGRVREQFRCLVAADEPLRLGRRRRGHPVRRGRRGQPPASHAARLQVRASARTDGDRGSSSRPTTARAADRTSSRPSTVGSTSAAGARLAARILPPDRITLGPAQISRLVFSTPRVSNLLGLTNLELRDLDKSSIDTVSLGKPHLVFLPRGIVQIQSLYKGANGPGVSRIIGATAFLNGRAGVGSDIEDAVRQALHEPPRVNGPASRANGPSSDAGRAPLPRDERAARSHDDHVVRRSPGRRTRARSGLGRPFAGYRPLPADARVRVNGRGPGRKHGRRQHGVPRAEPAADHPPDERPDAGRRRPTRQVLVRRRGTRSTRWPRSPPGAARSRAAIASATAPASSSGPRRRRGRPCFASARAAGRGRPPTTRRGSTVARGPRRGRSHRDAPADAGWSRRSGARPRSPSRSPDLVWPSLGSPATAETVASGDSARPTGSVALRLDADSARRLSAHHRRAGERRNDDADGDPPDRGARAMTTTPRPVASTAWRRHLLTAAACAAVGILAHLASPFLPVQLATVGLGIGLVGASFLLAWAADAGEAVFSGGLVLAVIALVTVLPEFIIETRFAYLAGDGARHGQPDRRDAAAPDRRDRPAARGRVHRSPERPSGCVVPARGDPSAGARDPADHVDLRDPGRRAAGS